MSETPSTTAPVEPSADEPTEPTTEPTTEPATEPSGPAVVEQPVEDASTAPEAPADFSGVAATAPVAAFGTVEVAPVEPVEAPTPAAVENPDEAAPVVAPVSLDKPAHNSETHELVVELVEKARWLEGLLMEIAKSPAVAALRSGEGLPQVIAAVVGAMRG